MNCNLTISSLKSTRCLNCLSLKNKLLRKDIQKKRDILKYKSNERSLKNYKKRNQRLSNQVSSLFLQNLNYTNFLFRYFN